MFSLDRKCEIQNVQSMIYDTLLLSVASLHFCHPNCVFIVFKPSDNSRRTAITCKPIRIHNYCHVRAIIKPGNDVIETNGIEIETIPERERRVYFQLGNMSLPIVSIYLHFTLIYLLYHIIVYVCIFIFFFRINDTRVCLLTYVRN